MQKEEEVKPYAVLAGTYRYNLTMLRTTMFFSGLEIATDTVANATNIFPWRLKILV